jgi:hypothetical protein
MVPYTPSAQLDNMGAMSFCQNVNEPDKVLTTGSLTVTLPVITIDSLHLPHCSIIKIDVEGMEEDVLLGASETLKTLRPVIYFEYASNNVGQLTRMHTQLNSLGYRLFWHVANPFNNRNFRGDLHNIFGGNVEVNILAVLPEHKSPNLSEITDPSIPPIRPSLAEALGGVAV